jgi:GNAT superfamily N-acetyltransferase
MKNWERNAVNLAASLSFYGPAEERAGVHLITSSVAFSVFNIALITNPVAEIEGEMDRRIQLANAHFRGRQRDWSFWLCEDYLGPRGARRLHRIFESHGMECIAESPGMETDELTPPRRALPALSYRRVNDATTRRHFAQLVTACFHIPPPISLQVYEPEEMWRGPLEVWLGYDGEFAVTSTALMEAAGVLGLYSVATLPAWRGRGLAEAIMRHAVADRRLRGVTAPLVLQSSPGGLELYKRLGFKRTTRFFVFSTP